MSDTDLTYCPGCSSEVNDLGVAEEDRHIVECLECGYVEVVYYQIGDELPDLTKRILNR